LQEELHLFSLFPTFTMNFWLLLIPVISSFIGWSTNLLAIKMLFHPRRPVRVLGLTFHGIFPKRQQVFAEKLGRLVSAELLSFGDIQEKITSIENLKKLTPLIEGHIENFLRVKLGDEMPMLSIFIGEKTIKSLKRIFMQELEILFPQIMKGYTDQLSHDLNLERIVTEKVAAFSSEKLESILFQIMSKEFRFVEILGGVIGFFIGLVQVLITVLTT